MLDQFTLDTTPAIALLERTGALGQLAATRAGALAEIQCRALQRTLENGSQWLLKATEVQDTETMTRFIHSQLDASQAYGRELLEAFGQAIDLGMQFYGEAARLMSDYATTAMQREDLEERTPQQRAQPVPEAPVKAQAAAA